ncbi:dihydrodipicolinate synthase family protein [Algoriphagus marinus]|uniref:dihydrodipicolinate synthase family protein n=1 Tax=Algoriphagus marinus TaxID=1925762 RepID=UPI00094BB834|nr:dihydrodipicolinate synthase family protein [Algoriphagus marinus]
MLLTKPFKGIIPPLITPLNPDFSLDYESLAKVIEHVIEGGVHGVFILGTTGEFASLRRETKVELIEETTKLVAGRIPVLVGITDCAFEESLNLAKIAKDFGADSVVATTPFYMNIGQEELVNYYEKLANSIDLPLFLYNMPGNTHKHISADTAAKLATHPNIIGIKDSSGDPYTFQAYLEALKSFPEFSVLVGPEEILADTLAMGGNGGVTGGANLFPKLYVALFEAFEKGEKDRVQELQTVILYLSKQLYQNERYSSSYLKGLKAAMSFEGLCQGILALPLVAFNQSEKEELKEKYKAVKKAVTKVLAT